MDLHRTAFKLDSSHYVTGSMAPPTLMVPDRGSVVPCQPPRAFGIPASLEKELQLPFPSGASYALYQRHPLLHLPAPFGPAPLAVLGPATVTAFQSFSSPLEDRETGIYHSAFLPTKRLKGCLEHRLRFPVSEGKEFDFGVNRAHVGSLGAMRSAEDSGKKSFSVSGLLETEVSCSPEEQKEGCKYTLAVLWGFLLVLLEN